MIDFSKVPSPCYVLDESLLVKNLELISHVQQKAGVTIILAFKGFAMWSAFPIVRKYIKGATASSLHEAMLCVEEMGVKSHTYAPVYLQQEFKKIMSLSSHITFNSLSQYELFKKALKKKKISAGLRVNPEFSAVSTSLYNPCMPGSRLGEIADNIGDQLPEGIEGLHFHVLCESDSYTLAGALEAFESKFGQYIPGLKWVNMGGGHLMTRSGYDTDHLIKILKAFRKRYPGVEVILEPGSAFAWETGVLVTTVQDIIDNRGIKTLMLDASFTAHMPDTLEMPYRPGVVGATDPVPGKPTYRLGGTSCLSGDFMSEYSFDKPVEIGDLIVFNDMIHYTMVKTTTFNGVPHPSIAIRSKKGELKLVRKFGYKDYKRRLS